MITDEKEPDYLDEVVADRITWDPEFARIIRAREITAELSERRRALGLTQQQVADRMGVARPRVTEIETRPDGIAFSRILEYARVLGASFQLVLKP